MHWNPHHKYPEKNDTRCRVILADGTEVEDVYYVTNHSTAYNWLQYECDENGKRIGAKELPIGYPTHNFVAFWQELPPPLDFEMSEEDIEFFNSFMDPQIQGRIALEGTTHPEIHAAYYRWLSEVQKGISGDQFDDYGKKLIDEVGFDKFHTIAMWVWTRSRERLAAKAAMKVQNK